MTYRDPTVVQMSPWVGEMSVDGERSRMSANALRYLGNK